MEVWVSSSPHIRASQSTSTVMRDVIIALIPTTIAGVVIFGWNALAIVCFAVAAAVATEALIQRLLKKEVTINDGSAVITGLLVALNVPSTAPWWLPVIGSIFAIAIVKQVFGGLGQNFMNPAMAARAFLLASFPMRMTAWIPPVASGIDATTYATPLVTLTGQAGQGSITGDTLLTLFLGNVGGTIGEVCKAALLVGALYLLLRGVVSWRIPLVYIATVFVFALLVGQFDVMFAFAHILSGGLFLGAWFMATDYTTSPLSASGHVVYAIGCGVITSVIRFFGGYPEGVTYAILLMNVLTPLIDKACKPRGYGRGRTHA